MGTFPMVLGALSWIGKKKVFNKQVVMFVTVPNW